MDEIMEQVKAAFVALYPTVSSASWKSLPVEQQVELRNTIAKGYNVFGKLRQAFDATVWAGHEDGSVKTQVESIRAKSDFKTRPGRRAAAPTVDDIFAKI